MLGHNSEDIDYWKAISYDAYNRVFLSTGDTPKPSEVGELTICI